MDRTRKSGMWFLAITVVVLYGLVSAAIAIATVDTCGDESDEKAWVVFPPKWDCGVEQPVVIFE
ncbi:MAG: hypothetical protein U5R31_14580 [Acidimicrobiia bacterium]|nr:hypothetical protein [Acidimicrobiia bacterium]